MELVLHHYDFSNFSEKVRLVLGFKRLAWHSVEIPAYAPKPDYTPLTAGYRRTPALQVGADIYCDTRLIVDVLETLAPTPTLYPGPVPTVTRAQSHVYAAWAESVLFRPLALYITGLHAARFPLEFHHDRARLHGKPLPTVAAVEAAAPSRAAEVEAQLARIEDLLRDQRPYLLGAELSLADIVVYVAPWFLEIIGGPSPLLERSPLTRSWMGRIAAIGHGTPMPFSASAALERACAARPAPLPATVPPGCAWRPGETVSVSPYDQYTPAQGTLVALDAERITLAHSDARCGQVHVHFPRLGYRLSRPRAAS